MELKSKGKPNNFGKEPKPVPLPKGGGPKKFAATKKLGTYQRFSR